MLAACGDVPKNYIRDISSWLFGSPPLQSLVVRECFEIVATVARLWDFVWFAHVLANVATTKVHSHTRSEASTTNFGLFIVEPVFEETSCHVSPRGEVAGEI